MSNWLWLLVLAALWSPSFLFIKLALVDVPPLTLAATRLTLAAIILVSVLHLRGERLPRRWEVWRKFFFMGFFANALPFALFSLGELVADSGMAAILNGTTPIFTVILAHFFIGDERLNMQKLGGVLIGFAGIVLLFAPEVQGNWARGGSVWGLVAFAVAAMSYGIGIVYARRNLRGLPPLVGPAAQLTMASVYLLPVALWVDRPFGIRPGLPAIGSLLALAVFGTALAFMLYYHLIERASATFLSLVTYILPPAGLLLGVIFLDESPGWQAVVGCGLIIVGVMVVNGAIGAAWQRWVQPSAVSG
ncbi:MAG: EamA family transporter [Caldilineae bacterium]|nr:MAG: EamA family transporter [Caldilineae bacterium]